MIQLVAFLATPFTLLAAVLLVCREPRRQLSPARISVKESGGNAGP